MNHPTALRVAVACLGLAIGCSVTAQVPPAEADSLIREGVAQFDRGEFGAARATFESVLEQQPDHVIAIYELAYTFVQLGEEERALEIVDDTLMRGLDVPAAFYSLSASVLDNLGRQEEAVRRFEQGIAAFPDDHGLHLNLGVTRLRLGELDAARAAFERAVVLQPEHPSAHFFLGQIYTREGQTAAAILAFGTSIGFDNQARRMSAAAGAIKTLMDGTFRTLDDGTPVAVLPVDSTQPPATLEQFSGRLPLHVTAAVAMQRESGGELGYEPYAMAYGLIVAAFVQAEIDTESHFAAGHYFRFYEPMVANGHSGTFAHLILAPLNPELASNWAQSNGRRMEAFRNWLSNR